MVRILPGSAASKSAEFPKEPSRGEVAARGPAPAPRPDRKFWQIVRPWREKGDPRAQPPPPLPENRSKVIARSMAACSRGRDGRRIPRAASRRVAHYLHPTLSQSVRFCGTGPPGHVGIFLEHRSHEKETDGLLGGVWIPGGADDPGLRAGLEQREALVVSSLVDQRYAYPWQRAAESEHSSPFELAVSRLFRLVRNLRRHLEPRVPVETGGESLTQSF
jgi:hypothetical protein